MKFVAVLYPGPAEQHGDRSELPLLGSADQELGLRPLLERQGLEVTDAALFDRPTPLEGADGLRNWPAQFARDLVGRVPPADLPAFFGHLEDAARCTLHRDGSWFADYWRLRAGGSA